MVIEATKESVLPGDNGHARSLEALIGERIRQLTSLDQKANSLIAATALFFTGVSFADFHPLKRLHLLQTFDSSLVAKATLQFFLILGAGLCLRCLMMTPKYFPWALEIPDPTEAQLGEMLQRLSRINGVRRRFFFWAYGLLCISVALMVCIYGALLVSSFRQGPSTSMPRACLSS